MIINLFGKQMTINNKKYKEKYIVQDTFSLWLDIKVMRINSMINYMNIKKGE